MYRNYDERNGRRPYGGERREAYLDRTEAYYAGSRSGPPAKRGGGKSQSASSKAYKERKEEKKRIEKGTEFTSNYVSDVKKSLLCGFESMEDVLKAKAYENTSRSVAIPVSTRVAGLSTVTIFNKATSTEANRQRLPPVTIFQIYRVTLAMIEKKIFENRIAATLDDRENWYDPIPFEEYKTTITSINICTQQVGALLRSISNFKYDETNFVPLLPCAQRNNGRLLPTPEIVCLSNLRETVLSLANAATSVVVRRNFRSRNSIPGAIFNERDMLMNPDEIMPNDYNAASLRNDLYAVKNWFEAVTDLRNAREKWLTKIQLTESTTGNESMLVSSAPETLRIEVENGRSTIAGDITEFWYRSKMGDQLVFYGTYHLGGELPSVARYVYPNYCIRTRQACGVVTKRSYEEVVLAIEN